MAVHHVLCIHGIGKHSDDWVDDKDDGGPSLRELLKATWDSYPATKSKGAFDQRVKLHSIHYDDEINKIFATWEEQSKKLKDALALPTEARAALAGSLLESLDTEVDEDAEAAWATEVNRRVAELDGGLVKTIPLAELRRRLAAR